jgi:hypothetical protein
MSAHVGERLAAYLDGELTPRERAEIDAHLGACPACARKLQALSSVDAAVRALPAEAPPGYFLGFPGRVRARLEAGKGRASWRLPVWYAAAAAALVVAVSAPLVLNRSQRPAAPASRDAAPVAVPAASPPAVPAASPRAARETPDETLRQARLKDETAADFRSSREPPAAPALDSAAAARALPKPSPAEEPAGEDRALSSGFAEGPPVPVPAAPGAPSAPSVASALPRVAEAPARDAERAGGLSLAEGRGGDERTEKKARELVLARRAPEAEADAISGEEASYRALLGRPARTRDEARDLREAWRAHLRLYPQGVRAEEARVRLVEAGHAAYRLGHEPEDLARFNEDAVAYLRRSDATQARRVQELLRSVER